MRKPLSLALLSLVLVVLVRRPELMSDVDERRIFPVESTPPAEYGERKYGDGVGELACERVACKCS